MRSRAQRRSASPRPIFPRSSSATNGLVRKSKAPSLMVCTALSTVPCAVMMSTGSRAWIWCAACMSAMPSIGSMRRSKRATSKAPAWSARSASAGVEQSVTSKPIASRRMPSTSRMLGSSSTTSMRVPFIIVAPAACRAPSCDDRAIHLEHPLDRLQTPAGDHHGDEEDERGGEEYLGREAHRAGPHASTDAQPPVAS